MRSRSLQWQCRLLEVLGRPVAGCPDLISPLHHANCQIRNAHRSHGPDLDSQQSTTLLAWQARQSVVSATPKIFHNLHLRYLRRWTSTVAAAIPVEEDVEIEAVANETQEETEGSPLEEQDASIRDGTIRRVSAARGVERDCQEAPVKGPIHHHIDAAHGTAKQAQMVVPTFVDGRTLPRIVDALKAARAQGLPDAALLNLAEPQLAQTFTTAFRRIDKAFMNAQRQYEHRAKRLQPKLNKRIQERNRLPMMAASVKADILKLVQENDVVVLVSGTGSGKTTQVPQMILDDALERGVGAECNIVCTQPRRISATSVARRVAFERDEALQKSVGFHVRFSAHLPYAEGSILYCTSGVLLKQLQSDPERVMAAYSVIIIDEVHERSMPVDLLLTTIRDLIFKKATTPKSRRPKLLLMSATIDSEKFVSYFSESLPGKSVLKVASKLVDGRSFHVETHYLDEMLPILLSLYGGDSPLASLLQNYKADAATLELTATAAERTQPCSTDAAQGRAYPTETVFDDTQSSDKQSASIINNGNDEQAEAEPLDDDVDEGKTLAEKRTPAFDTEDFVPCPLVSAMILHVAQTSNEGDILVFLPGLAAIDDVEEILTSPSVANIICGAYPNFKIFKLHSSLHDTNDNVFAPVPPGCRRIVLATNIAETSITLPDVIHVIDAGKVRQMHYDQAGECSEYNHRWISKASSFQRRGRAGRVQDGHYYPLFTRQRYDVMKPSSPPEMLRLDLVLACLDIKAQPDPPDIREFLDRSVDPPGEDRVGAAIATLQRLGALTDNQDITPLGRILALIPAHPSLSKGLLLGILFRCFEPMLIIACQDSDLVLVDHENDRAGVANSKRIFAGSSDSDLYATINAFREFDDAVRNSDAARQRQLQRERFVRPGVYREMSKIAAQMYAILTEAGVLPAPYYEKSVFEAIPANLNTNSNNIPLVKALALATVNSNFAFWDGKSWCTADAVTVLMAPRTVCQPRKRSEANLWRRLRKPGDLLAYLQKVRNHDEKYPWMTGITVVTPLMAILFSKVVTSAEDQVVINEFMRSKVLIPNNTLGLDDKMSIQLLIETRKAIDRFLKLAFSDLRDMNNHRRTPLRGQQFNTMFLGDNALRDTVVKGLIDILDADNEAFMERRKEEDNELEDAIKRQRAKHEAPRKRNAEADSAKESRELEIDDSDATEMAMDGVEVAKSQDEDGRSTVPATLMASN